MKNKEAVINFPESLRTQKQWILWKYETRGDGTVTKVPYQINGRKAAINRPNEWSTFEECYAIADEYDGMGYVFTEGVTGIDLDKCFESDGSLKEFAQEVLLSFDSYTEFSPSGHGLHVLIQSDLPLDGRRHNGIECYSTARFFTVTGNVYKGRNVLRDCDVSAWHKETFAEKKPAPVYAESTGYLPDDERILSVMFRSKGGKKVQTLYDSGSWQSVGYGSQSEADLALVGSLMFFCRNNMQTVDRLFRSSKLMRDKWDEKRGALTYGQQTMEAAIKSEVMGWKPSVEKPTQEADGYIMTEGKHPVPMLITENICRVFLQDTELRSGFRLNDFSHMIEAAPLWLCLQDHDILDALRYVSSNYPCFAKVSKEMIVDGIRSAAYLNKVNPPIDYLTGLEWDRQPRLDVWLTCVYGVPDDELHQKIGSNWLKGLVRRVTDPGCQFDEVLVLEGAQGFRKSTSLRVLGSPWHVESTLSTDDRDFYMLLARNIIVEFSEGDIVGRTSARKLKAIITKTEDSYRPPYERGLLTFKRGCVFAMTTNDSDYQKDETGGRRWLPVVLQQIADIDWLRANREQLYAEAYYRVVVLKETSHEYPMIELEEIQTSKMVFDEYTEAIEDWYSKLPDREKEAGVLATEAYHGAINAAQLDVPQVALWRIGAIFRNILRLKNKPVRRAGVLKKRWVSQLSVF